MIVLTHIRVLKNNINKEFRNLQMSKIFSMFEQKDIFQTSCALLSGFDSDINELHLQYYRVIKRHQWYRTQLPYVQCAYLFYIVNIWNFKHFTCNKKSSFHWKLKFTCDLTELSNSLAWFFHNIRTAFPCICTAKAWVLMASGFLRHGVFIPYLQMCNWTKRWG